MNPPQTLDQDTIRRITRQIDQTCELMSRLSGTPIAAADFFQVLTTRTLGTIDGVAGAVWLLSPQGMLQLQHQTNLGLVGLEDQRDGKRMHGELLKFALESKKFVFLDPGAKIVTPSGAEAANLTTYPVAVAPVLSDQGDIFGLFEVWLDGKADPRLRNVCINFITQMAGFATNFFRNSTALRNTVQEQVFTQLETFSRQIHASLNPTEVAYIVANEGRRLIACDRISVGVRHGRRTTIEAVSGSDVVEKASVQVKMMRDLFDAVLRWNERLIYRGVRDETLPEPVLHALDDYLSVSNPKLLVLTPLRDEREAIKTQEKEPKPGAARSALLLESFEPPELIDPMIQRFDIVANHAASALYNAAEMKRIPFRILWRPLMALQGAAGGKRRFYTFLFLGLFTAFILAMIFIPYPYKLDAKGQLVPEERNYIYSTGSGRIVQFKVSPGQVVRPNTPIAILHDQELGREITQQRGEIDKSRALVELLASESRNQSLPATKRMEKADEHERERNHLKALTDQLKLLIEQRRADEDHPGLFTIFAPEFRRSRNAFGPAVWKVVSADFQEQLVNRWVKPSDPLLRVANTAGAWQIELKIPQKHNGYIRRAFKTNNPNEYLEVDVLVTSLPTQSFRGRLYRRDVTEEAAENKDDHNESERVVYSYVRVNDPDMPKEDFIPEELLVTGVEVHTKIRCGERSLGYCLFNGVYEFLYEHVFFNF
jgi:hypothetical protein